ncbi:hypothetical protein B5F40_02440 [Gordonibacter sp. An230]|uniref:DUF4405 domain-containing protein n=1 Tax=Gordonibacter sp. An230 TaxID=1965592 RepID=UPI000B398FD1|nr:DUF4405 domain-containing protein [Gordonibacter sp. An230]OUO91716.1 hypothetical protein B5F40_02440 [Gordonibacter sp. An230]
MVRIAFDVALLAAYALAAVPALTGAGAHEWLGLVVVATLLVHCGRRGTPPSRGQDYASAFPRAAAGRAVLNGLIVLALAVCAVSGVMVSGAVLPSLGLYAQGYFLWDPVHAASAKILMALILMHLALNARVVMTAARGLRVRRRGNLP